jgi:isoleucyl-tRNA synthetase
VSRIDDVGNPWLDAGIVSFSTIKKDNQGEPLYLSNREEWKKWFPADFITESFPGQFKNWFYALIAMATVLEDTNPFKTVLGFGTLLGEDGRPMHKSWGNMIEFNEGADKIGVDVMRWMYGRQNPAENMLFGYKKADEVRRLFYLLLWNVYRFFIEYAALEKFKPEKEYKKVLDDKNLTILDQWIISRLSWLVARIRENLQAYNAKDAALLTEKFVDDLSTWYLRLSRERVWVNSDDEKDKQCFYRTLYFVLVNLSIVLSPVIPFLTEEIYTNLTGEKSVHLSDWPSDLEDRYFNPNLESDMDYIRSIVEIGRRIRKENRIKVRQPLASATITLPNSKKFLVKGIEKEAVRLISKELNVKSIVIKFKEIDEIKLDFNFNLNDELRFEGEVRELIRQIQQERKGLQLSPDKSIVVQIPEKFASRADYIKKRVVASKIIFGETFKIIK